jgi:hypothetical protein
MANVAAPTYPREYHAILLALRPDGTPITIRKESPAAAKRYQLEFYNFLKWCKRAKNAHSVAHLGGRYNHVAISVRDNTVSFILKSVARFKASEDDVLAQLAEQGIDPQALKVPESYNPKVFHQRAAGEVEPLQPFEDTGNAPDSDPLPLNLPLPQALAASDWRSEDEKAADLAKFQKMIRDAEISKEQGVLTEVKPLEWFQGERRALGDKPLDQGSPQRRLQLVMEALIIECRSIELPYPVSSKDSHEPISAAQRTILTKAWTDYFIQHGMMLDVLITEGDIGWRFTLTEDCERELAKRGIPARVRRTLYLEEDKNNIRLKTLQYFKENTL